jgi:hypothetical protein
MATERSYLAGEVMARIRVKPSRSQAMLGMVMGVLFVGIGLFAVIPIFGAFGIVWTLMAVAITVYSAINVFSPRGLAHTEIDIERDAEPQEGDLQFDERLRRLERLRDERLISEAEYERKREEIMGQQW